MVNEPAESSCPQRVGTAGFTNPSQQWCSRSWGFHTVRAGRPRGYPLSYPIRWNCRCMECFLFRRRNCILPDCRWLHEPQAIHSQPVGLGSPHRAGRYRSGGSPFSSPMCGSCRYMEGFLIRGWDSLSPGWRWLYEPEPISNQPVG